MPWTSTWKAETILDLHFGCERCSGTTLKGLKCRNPINAANRCRGREILADIPHISWSSADLEEALAELADCLLCVRDHRRDPWQQTVVIQRWRRAITRAQMDGMAAGAGSQRQWRFDVPKHSTDEKTDSPKYADSSTQTQRSSKQQSVPGPPETKSAKEKEKLQREFERKEEAKRQARLKRERQQAEARARAEQEAQAERKRRQAAQDEERRRAQRRQEEAEEQKITWEASWAVYRLQWDNFRRLPATTSSAQLIKSTPRPTKAFHSTALPRQDKNFEQDVEAFFRHMPEATTESVASRTKLRRKLKLEEAVNWHPDKIAQRFPYLGPKDEVMMFANSVMRVITNVLSSL